MTVPIQLQHLPRRRKPTYLRWAFLWAIAVLTIAALVGIDYQIHETQQRETKRHASAQRACPPGYAVDWSGPNEMQCLKEMP